MVKMYIPPLGTELTLEKDWSFVLHREQRNNKFAELIGIQWKVVADPTYYWRTPGESAACVLPAGTVMYIDRYYIRQGAEEFDSVTFVITHLPIAPDAPQMKVVRKKAGRKTVARFWAPLDDVNNMFVCD